MTAWSIEEFTVTAAQAERDRTYALCRGSRRFTPAGTYTRLVRDGRVIMSDTPDELRDLCEFQRRATGRVLINGLGLGIAARMALEKPEVIHVDIVEIECDVIELVGRNLTCGSPSACEKLHVWCGDAYGIRWMPNVRWDVVWHDVWDDICADNLEGMKRLHRRYGRRCDWQGSWCREQCEAAAKGRRAW